MFSPVHITLFNIMQEGTGPKLQMSVLICSFGPVPFLQNVCKYSLVDDFVYVVVYYELRIYLVAIRVIYYVVVVSV